MKKYLLLFICIISFCINGQSQLLKDVNFYIAPNMQAGTVLNPVVQQNLTGQKLSTNADNDYAFGLKTGVRIKNLSIDLGLDQNIRQIQFTDNLSFASHKFEPLEIRINNQYFRYNGGIEYAFGKRDHFFTVRTGFNRNILTTKERTKTTAQDSASAAVSFRNTVNSTYSLIPEIGYEYTPEAQKWSFGIGVFYTAEHKNASDIYKVWQTESNNTGSYTASWNGEQVTSQTFSTKNLLLGLSFKFKWYFAGFNFEDLAIQKKKAEPKPLPNPKKDLFPPEQTEEVKREEARRRDEKAAAKNAKTIQKDTRKICFSGRAVHVAYKAYVKNKHLKIRLFDNEHEDGDITSVCYNNQLIVKELKLTKAGTEYYIDVTPGTSNMLLSFAHNLGSEFLNTLSIEIFDGSSNPLFFNLTSDKKKCASLEIVYTP
ncbi:MAG: hypothetical protein V4543_06780 [Bacteroidota bacterium]